MKRRNYRKAEFPLENIRKFLEPGPIVLVSSRWKGKANIMTMGWQTVMEFTPSLVGCVIAGGNHSFEMIRNSGECVINIPTLDMIDTVVGIGNSTGGKVDKFKKFQLTAEDATKVKAPLIKECYANFECKLVDRQLIRKYNYFIFEVVRALVAEYPKYPKTVHYRGEGIFMVLGKHVDLSRRFKPQNL
jgi:flavin reductase (DIM6/NTAB) family NADH-FMN oxidoreductase RutF